MRTKYVPIQKRTAPTIDFSDDEIPEPVKKTKTLSKKEEKMAQESEIDTFFGYQTKTDIKSYGNPQYQDFPGSEVSIWHWNVNGVHSVLDKGHLQSFVKKANPTILCLNEIKTDDSKLSSIEVQKGVLKDYLCYWNCCSVKKGYAGTALLTKVQPVSVTFDMGVSKHDGEGRVITAEFKEFIVVATYVPNSGEGLKRLKYRVDEWDKDFSAYLQALRASKKKPLILTGDLNVAHNEIDIYDPKGKEKIACYTPQERESFGNFLKKGYVDTFRHLHPDQKEFSFWSARINARSDNRGWRLDYFIINQEDMGCVVDSTIHNEYLGSDHCPIQLRLNLTKLTSSSKLKKSKSKASIEDDEKNEGSEGEEETKTGKRSKSQPAKKTAAKSKSLKKQGTNQSKKSAKADETVTENSEDEQEESKVQKSPQISKEAKGPEIESDDEEEYVKIGRYAKSGVESMGSVKVKKIPAMKSRGFVHRKELIEEMKVPSFSSNMAMPKVAKQRIGNRIQQQQLPQKPQGPQWDDDYKKYDEDF